ncbi:MAG: protein kinase [Pyrinomonadaceae bacterium]|nr:protein kinase [Pyrinomonadaceae bacterium]
MNLESLIGQTLDSKYSIERELGRGGMGAVYLATHIGTERPVALKVIVPQFMQRAEFVERFRREARAAGRLRHPNVVDVTDFGFAETSQGRVAYLVMEYLDGCTLGEILDEEKQLPLGWTLDIVEQVCSAVHEAHGQGIIHRDLKPDNIWLEPNQRGGYTVKVLDFGIAKLEEPMSGESENQYPNPTTTTPTQSFHQGETLTDQANAETIAENRGATMIGEKGTLIQSTDDEKGTAIFQTGDEKGTAILSVSDEKGTQILPAAEISSEDGTAIFPGSSKGTQLLEKDEKGTRLIATGDQTDKSLAIPKTAELTRVGAVLGTPLYMSPEQCRGEKLSPRSDIYSLAVIVYQMLSGKTPFTGDFTQVMDSHKELPPPPLDAKKIPRNVKKVLFSALAKNVDERPPTAEAFASELRSHSEGFGKLLQRASVLYTEHLPKFLGLAILLSIPHILLIIFRIIIGILASANVLNLDVAMAVSGFSGFIDFFVQIFTAALMVGTVTWLVAHILAFPLKPVSLKSALKASWEKKRSLFTTVTVTSLISFIGMGCCLVPGIYISTIYMLVTPAIIMEGVKGRAAFRRSRELTKRSFWTALAIAVLIFLIPMMIGGAVGVTVSLFSKQLAFYEEKLDKKSEKSVKTQSNEGNYDINVTPTKVEINEKDDDNNVDESGNKEKNMAKMRRETFSRVLLDLLLTPIMILLTSITAVITSLMYFKTRQAGGESMQDLLEKFEDSEHPQSKWQHRIRDRLVQSGRISSTERNEKKSKV